MKRRLGHLRVNCLYFTVLFFCLLGCGRESRQDLLSNPVPFSTSTPLPTPMQGNTPQPVSEPTEKEQTVAPLDSWFSVSAAVGQIHAKLIEQTNQIRALLESRAHVPVFRCETISTGWITIENHREYKIECPDPTWEGTTCSFDFYDLNGPTPTLYSGMSHATWERESFSASGDSASQSAPEPHSGVSTCRTHINDGGISQGRLQGTCCKIF